MGNDVKKIIINSVFTFLILGALIAITIESKLHFNSKLQKMKESLTSGIENYKIKYSSGLPEAGYDIANSSKVNIYDKKPIKIIQKLQNIHEIENKLSSDSEAEVPKEIENDILENPLLKGYYVQLGIFSDKAQAQNSIQNLLDKMLINGDFIAYIETKFLQEKPFYLTQIGVFATKNQAITFCDNLQKTGIGCLIVD
jgi:hypothetical protein